MKTKLLLMMSMVVGLMAGAAQANLLTNPGFEDYMQYYSGEGETLDFKINDGSGATTWDNPGELNVEIASTEIFQVPAYQTSTVTSSVLEEGQLYCIEARGTYVWWGTGQTPADAEWWEDPYIPGEWYENKPDEDPPYDQMTFDLLINETEVDWWGTTDGIIFSAHTYSPSHVYRFYYMGQGQPIDFRIYDPVTGDNSGSLEVEIFPVPEPCTLLLLALGGTVMLRKRNRNSSAK